MKNKIKVYIKMSKVDNLDLYSVDSTIQSHPSPFLCINTDIDNLPSTPSITSWSVEEPVPIMAGFSSDNTPVANITTPDIESSSKDSLDNTLVKNTPTPIIETINPLIVDVNDIDSSSGDSWTTHELSAKTSPKSESPEIKNTSRQPILGINLKTHVRRQRSKKSKKILGRIVPPIVLVGGVLLICLL